MAKIHGMGVSASAAVVGRWRPASAAVVAAGGGSNPNASRGEEQQATKRGGGEEQLTTSGLGYIRAPPHFLYL